jgi:Mce-associated membrane protein
MADGGGRARPVLLAAVVVLLLALAAEGWLLRDGATRPAAGLPVTTAPVETAAAVRSAASSAHAILSYGFEDLDAQLDDAARRMTPGFAATFRERVAAGQQELVTRRATQEARVVAAGVVRAADDEVTALVFLDRLVASAGSGTTRRSERVLVTVVRRDGVWLVSDIRTR